MSLASAQAERHMPSLHALVLAAPSYISARNVAEQWRRLQLQKYSTVANITDMHIGLQ